MSNISILAAKGAQIKNNSVLNTENSASTLSKLVAGEKTDNMIAEEERAKNQGGFFGGIGYVFEKIGLGFLSGIEGIWDYAAGGLAKLFGADDWAEQQFANDWVNYNHADEWFNPSDGWKTAGDVAGGIGTSLPAIAGVAAAGAIAYFSGGTLSPVAAGLISASIAGLGAAGRATKEAYDQTGELGGKEFGYGALVGATEGVIEGVSAGIGVGTGQVVKGISKSFGKEVAESATRQTLGKAMIKGFIGEAFEEGVAEMITPVWKRLTYDPNAKNATAQEVGYAALIGGLSGALMGGFDVSVRNIASTSRGNTIASEGKANNVLNMAQQLSEYETENNTGYEQFQVVKNTLSELQTSLQKTGGEVTTLRQKMLLGVLEQANTSAAFTPFVAQSARNIVNNAEVIAQKLSSYGYTDANGKALTFTAEQIMEGIDVNNPQSFVTALKENAVLRTLAVADATGQLSLDSAKFKQATLMGQQLASQVDLNRFIETATDSELKAVGEQLGIDNWQGITSDEFNNKIIDFVNNGGVETYRKERLIVKDVQNIDPTAATSIPKLINIKEDGAVRYTKNGTDIAVIKNGDTYRIYDYESGRLTKTLTKSEVNKILREINSHQQEAAGAITKELEKQSDLAKQASEIDSYARENIKDYAKLNESNKSMIRAIIRQGRAAGVADDFLLSTARVSARSGLNVVFSKEASFVTASGTYADGAIDLKNNRIIINPEAKTRTGEMILIHELTHAVYNNNGVLTVAEGLKSMSNAEKEAIRKRYKTIEKGGAVEVSDEINAHFAEQTLANKNILERLVADKPTVKEKILSFFKKSTTDYSEDAKLTGAAKKLYKQYKKLFDEFTARNQQGNLLENQAQISDSKAFALANDDKNSYNSQKGAVDYGKETSKTNQTTENSETIRRNDVRSDSGQRVISVFNDYGTVRQLSEIVKNAKTAEKIGEIFTEIYTKPQTETQENLAWHAKNEDIAIYFAKPRNNSANIYSYDGKNLIVNENISEKNLVDILNKEKPIKRIISSDKIAHISSERWSRFISSQPNAYLTRIPIQQFLDMTTEDYVTQRQLNARSSQISKRASVENIKNTADEFMYLEIDLKNKRVTNHEGRHRMTALLNAGNAFADVFVIPVNDTGVESYGNIEVQGQFNTDKHNLGLVRAKSARFANAINEVFRKDDGNIRYALPETDSKGNTLTAAQREYFKDSKVVDEKGQLLPVYHGTNSREETSVWNSKYNWYDTEYKTFTVFKPNEDTTGFFFADEYDNAGGYGSTVYEVYLNIKNPLIIECNNANYSSITHNGITQDTYEWAAWAKKKGYDGVIFKNIRDGVDYGAMQKSLNEYVAFSSRQIKQINNKRPTFDNDIRYALSKDSDIKDLVAIHNTTETKLLDSIKLGGLAVPSIAITKADYGHENFGEISLIFKKDSVDPANTKNKVYNADVYSKRFPKTVTKFSDSAVDELQAKFAESAKIFNEKTYSIEDYLKDDTIGNIVDKLFYKNYVRIEFLKDSGITFEPVYKDYSLGNSKDEAVLEMLISKFEPIITNKQEADYDYVMENVKPEVAKVLKEQYTKLSENTTMQSLKKSYKELAENIDNDLYFREVDNYIIKAKEHYKNKGSKVLDERESYEKLRELTNGKEKEIKRYIRELLNKYDEGLYFRNDKDYYTSSGYPRSFNQLYNKADLQSIVQYMVGNVQNSEGYSYGVGNVRSLLAKQYKSISEIKQDSDKILSAEEMGEFKAESQRLFEALCDEIGVQEGVYGVDTTPDLLVEIAGKKITTENILKTFREWHRPIPKIDTISNIKQFFAQLKDYPTEYFEVKPQRVVDFGEVVKVFAPSSTDPQIIDYFTSNNISVELYDSSTPTRAELVKTLPDDIKFALPMDENEDRVVGGLTRGQRAKFVANNTKLKVYSKTDAVDIINSIIDERLVLGDKYGSLSGKNKSEAIDMLFRQLNATTEGYRGTAALHIADYLIENTILNDMYIDDSSEAMWQLKILQSYMHKVDLKSIQSEINYKYDKKNSINLVWGAKQGGMAPDVIAQELNSLGVRIDAINEADCFFEMVDTYNSLKAQVNKRADKQKLSAFGSESQLETLRQEIARDILLAYDEKGTQSKYGKLVEKYTAKIQGLKQQVKETERRNNVLNAALEKAQNMKDLKLGTFLNATEFKSDIFKQSIERLGKIKWRGNLNSSGTHRIMADLKQWYVKDNPILEDCYEQGIADMLDVLSTGSAKYSTDELVMLNNVLSYFTNFVKNYNRVYKQGKWIEALPEAEKYIDILHSNEKIKVGLFKKFAGSTYTQTFGDPMTVARRMDLYENGFYTEMMTDLREAAIDAQVAEMEVKSKYDNFLSAHKKYLTEITKTKVKYKDVEIPKAQLIGLAMTLKREHAQAGLALNGFSFVDTDKKKIRVKGFAPSVMSDAELLTAVVEEQAYIDSLLSDTDREYISILETAYNQDAKKLKADRDMQRLGFTNATEDYYYPIRRGNIAKNIDTSDIAAELDRVSNSSFNKDTVKGAKQELFIESADTVFNRHIHAVCQYSYLSPAIETFNRLFNLDISGNRNKPISIATESANTWAKGNKYFSKLISDIQGIPSSSSEGMKALSFIRGNYAKFQLGANPKVWLTQLSSLFSSSSILDADSLVKGMAVSTKDVDTYCPLAKLRNSDNTAAMAQGVLDRSVGKVSNALMAPIGKMDRFVVRKLFGACQVQVAKDGGAKVGTHENKAAAGQLLKRVILETQQNSIATERSAAMRSGNEVLRMLTMFTADSMKVVGRVIDSVGEYSTIRAKLKAATDPNVKARLTTQLKAAQRKMRKSITALLTSAAFMAGIAKLFRWLYNKEDENETETVMVDFVGNLFGGLPLVKDVYARIAEGYELDNYAYSAINDLLDSASNMFKAAQDIISGTTSEQDIARNIKSLTYSVGQIFGIPTRNLYNVAYGLTKRVSPSSAYKIDNVFYNKNYVSDLKEAIANDDEQMIATIMSLLLNERIGDDVSDKVRNKLHELYAGGYSVLPKSVGDSITYNGETITLTNAKQESIKNIYSKANNVVERVIANTGFALLSDKAQAKAIKQVYDAYYTKAINEVLGLEDDNTLLQQAKYLDMAKLSVINAGISEITSDKDKGGKTITGSKKANIIKFLNKQAISLEEKLLVLALQGYTVQDGDIRGLSAAKAKIKLLKYIINLKGLTSAEKAELAQKCGFEVKNGKIVKQSMYSYK